ncbi:hypothetical protein H7F33_16245 [Pedobacter sp. PAMC26386]|nr:hypothetical protein H7F33_16245 [Pedobacter sp. PAMC26386]
MKIKLIIRKEVQIQLAALEGKIDNYLKKNFYRVTDRGEGFVIFIDDEYSDRKRYRSDNYIRIKEGKFEFHSSGKGTFVKLIYLTSVLYPFFIMMLFTAGGLYTKTLTPIFFSFAFYLPVLYRIYYLKKNMFNELLEC